MQTNERLNEKTCIDQQQQQRILAQAFACNNFSELSLNAEPVEQSLHRPPLHSYCSLQIQL